MIKQKKLYKSQTNVNLVNYKLNSIKIYEKASKLWISLAR